MGAHVMSGALMLPRLPRYPIQLPVLHKPKALPPTRAGVGWTRNVGEGGACVELAEDLKPGMPVCLHFLANQGPIEAEAQVVWIGEARQGDGGVLHGFTFTHLAPIHLPVLTDLLLFKGKRKIRDGGVRLPLNLSVACQFKESAEAVQGWTGNLSRGGVMLRLPWCVPVRTVLRMTLHTPTGPLDEEGLVVWADSLERWPPGAPVPHGLRFTSLRWSSSLTLGLLLLVPS